MTSLTDRFVQFILGDSWRYAKDAGWLFILALMLPLWQIVAGFGHHAVLGPLPLWKLLVIAALGLGYGAWKRAPLPGILLTVCLLIIATTGKSPTMQALAPVLTLFATDLLLFGLGVFLWTGTIFGYAVTPGPPATIVSGLEPARQNFQSFMIYAFWLNITAFAVARAGHTLSAWFVLTLLSGALILVPGALATSGRTAFLVMFRLTSTAFIVSIGLGLVIALQGMDVLGTREELSRAFRTFLWEATDLETYYLPWAVAILTAVVIKRLILRWTNIPVAIVVDTLCTLFLAAVPIVVLIWLFGQRRALARAWRYLFPYVAFPLEMPVIYSENQAIFIVLTALSVLLLLYKSFRGEASKLSWGRALFIVIVLWGGIYGGREVYFYVRY